MNHFLRTSVLFLFILQFVVSCQSTIPTSADMDRFYQQATDIANRQIALLDQQLARGEITQAQRDQSADAIRANISKQAGDLAWARHELAESEKRALGIPTGDSSVSVKPPQPGTTGSFQSARGEPGSGYGRNADPSLQPAISPTEVQGLMDNFQQQANTPPPAPVPDYTEENF